MPDDADAFGAGCPENPVDHPGKGESTGTDAAGEGRPLDGTAVHHRRVVVERAHTRAVVHQTRRQLRPGGVGGFHRAGDQQHGPLPLCRAAMQVIGVFRSAARALDRETERLGVGAGDGPLGPVGSPSSEGVDGTCEGAGPGAGKRIPGYARRERRSPWPADTPAPSPPSPGPRGMPSSTGSWFCHLRA